MKKPQAMSVSIGVLGAIDTLLTATLIRVPVWVTFIAWASFFSVGGGKDGFKRSLACNLAGVAIGSATLLAIALFDAGSVLASVCVGVGSAAMVQASKLPWLSATPSIVFGFASTVGTMFATNTKITTLGIDNPGLIAAVAMLLGASFGLLSEIWGNGLTHEADQLLQGQEPSTKRATT
jgi:hypothetical protein